MNTTYCYYHNADMDGISSAAIVHKALDGKVTLIGVNYGDEVDLTPVRGNDIIIVDFSFPPEQMRQIRDTADSLTWIDHHVTAKNSMKDVWFDKKVKGRRSIVRAGCALTWLYYYPKKDMPLAIKLLEDYDLWKFKFKDLTRSFQEAIWIDIDSPTSTNWEELLKGNEATIKGYSERGDLLRKAKMMRIKKTVKSGFEAKFHGFKTLFVNSNHDTSDLGSYICSELGYRIAVIYSQRGEKLICSLRSIKIDVGTIAKMHGGGGHRLASGFVVDGMNVAEDIVRLEDASQENT